jgi:hypothetical protein
MISKTFIQSIFNNYRRDSFSDRICDDLSEVILQYLSLEGKVRLECVSKQFQRTIFIRHHEMTIESMLSNLRLEGMSLINMNSFESLIKRCPNITSLRFRGFVSTTLVRLSLEVISMLSIHCAKMN